MDNHNTDKKGRKLFVFSEMETKSCGGVGGGKRRLVVLEGWGKARGSVTEERDWIWQTEMGDTGLAKAQSGESTVIQEMSQPGGENYPQLPGATKKAAKA